MTICPRSAAASDRGPRRGPPGRSALVIAAAFLAVGYWFGAAGWYRERIAIPASAAIALVGAWWVVERTLL